MAPRLNKVAGPRVARSKSLREVMKEAGVGLFNPSHTPAGYGRGPPARGKR